jgi:hypothetical protein
VELLLCQIVVIVQGKVANKTIDNMIRNNSSYYKLTLKKFDGTALFFDESLIARPETFGVVFGLGREVELFFFDGFGFAVDLVGVVGKTVTCNSISVFSF